MRTLGGFAGLSCTAPDLTDAISARRPEEDLGKIPNKKVSGAKTKYTIPCLIVDAARSHRACLYELTSLQSSRTFSSASALCHCTMAMRLLKGDIHLQPPSVSVFTGRSASGPAPRAFDSFNTFSTLADRHVVQPILDGFRSHRGFEDRFQPWLRALSAPSACHPESCKLEQSFVSWRERGGWGRHADAHVQHDLTSPSRRPSLPPTNPVWCG
ncbi:hypothetical protein COCC4DRAFT_55147 [Bipolaris maydis ATCC 48331]|uniref:Uncharacterized protein n=2 Tax=Cochliobolus heterostrophus TaxID=5016 RepID=M2UPV6_COCH5|nr:uncharacterized protein COCC4DRAFT_55147 [Bipolaris maydis ATCC 48331]EMD95626.1 hypothetical protein COCHEDRAFT_1151735 [Bipolaris maydis C5]ENI10487.1 hypothetical protein COCC4DRAFT_55147 [Bipolaris maydis ATCC 48331]KAJ6213569.1 hypothetical protein PSV09DRAFT_1151735 [Bipolaris maydis]